MIKQELIYCYTSLVSCCHYVHQVVTLYSTNKDTEYVYMLDSMELLSWRYTIPLIANKLNGSEGLLFTFMNYHTPETDDSFADHSRKKKRTQEPYCKLKMYLPLTIHYSGLPSTE